MKVYQYDGPGVAEAVSAEIRHTIQNLLTRIPTYHNTDGLDKEGRDVPRAVRTAIQSLIGGGVGPREPTIFDDMYDDKTAETDPADVFAGWHSGRYEGHDYDQAVAYFHQGRG